MYSIRNFRRVSVLFGMPGLFVVVGALFSACSESTAPDTSGTPVEVAVTAIDPLGSIGATATMTAAVRNANHQAIPGIVVSSWESSNPAVATVNATTGLVTAVANGAVAITAHSGALAGSASVVVQQRVSSVTVAGVNVIGSLGSTVQLTAAAADAGGTAVVGRAVQWTSANAAVATVDAASGVVTARGTGNVTIAATIDGTAGTRDVSIIQIPASIIPVASVDTLRSIGATSQYTAAVKDSGGSAIAASTVSWTSANPAVVMVNSTTGLATAVAPGTATITAHYATLTGSADMIVRQRVNIVAVTGLNAMGSLGSTVTFAAAASDAGGTPIAGRAVQWSSSNAAIASVDAASGVVTARGPGSATIGATIDGAVGNRDVSVVQVPISMALVSPTDTLRSLGATGQYTAVVKDSGGSAIVGAVVRWTSTNSAVATLDSVQGLATAVSNGAVYVHARSAGPVDSVRLTVRQRIDPTKSTISVVRPLLFVGDTVRATLQTRDALDHPLSFGGAIVVISNSGGTSAGVLGPTVDRGDGTYTSDFIGSVIGTARTVGASFDGTAVLSAAPTLRVVGFTKIGAGGSLTYPGAIFGGITCGTITNGQMYCWGGQENGVRGTGVVPEPHTQPTLVIGGHQWTDFEVSQLSVCGITENAKLYCWGAGVDGVLGNGGINGINEPTPIPIVPESSFVSVSLGHEIAACAITTGHSGMCWSQGGWGRLGNGTETDAPTPVPVSGGIKFATIATSFAGTCGVSDAGAASCWGNGNALGIGTGPFPDDCGGVGCSKVPIPVSGGVTFKPIMAREGNNACAVATDGKTYCWGIQYSRVPTELVGAPVFTQLATGEEDACGVALGGAVYCWGQNTRGRFGNPPDPNSRQAVPALVPGGHTFTQISMGPEHMCGVTTDGHAWCWGSNEHGQLGDGTTTPSSTPVRVKLFAP
jgi:alpha-tubulin suppressor-like RCC1 family protein/uncharacterized protein YjdB